MITALSLLAVALYLATTGAIGLRVRALATGHGAISRELVLLTWSGAVLLHAVVAYRVVLTPAGLDLGFFHALSSVTWLMVALLLFASLKRPVENIGLLLLPLAIIAVLLDRFVPEISFTPASSQRGLDIHIFLSLLAYSMLGLAALQAMVLWFQDRHLHTHRPGGLLRALPPLQHMECLLFQLLGVGFVLLSASLITGFIYLEDIFAQQQVHKTALSIVAWGLFATLLFGRWRFGWRGRKAIRWTLGGFVFLMLAYFGSKLVIELILGQA
ncbi:MAG TPA: phosphohydrolase [Thioalkalivibrio sp.]|nr:phosphohydrolase [Thioalkalivibrio sp.]